MKEDQFKNFIFQLQVTNIVVFNSWWCKQELFLRVCVFVCVISQSLNWISLTKKCEKNNKMKNGRLNLCIIGNEKYAHNVKSSLIKKCNKNEFIFIYKWCLFESLRSSWTHRIRLSFDDVFRADAHMHKEKRTRNRFV